MEQVRKDGDAAVKSFTSKFDRVELETVCVRIEVGRGAGAACSMANRATGRCHAVCLH